MEELSMHVLDIVENSLEVGATTIEIELLEDLQADRLEIIVRDNGPGMTPEQVSAARDPFFTTRTTRRVGMGLALLDQAARAAEGGLTIDSEAGAGTLVRAHFRHGHLDRAPIGDMETTLLVLLAAHAELCIRFRHRRGDAGFELDSSAIKAETLPARLTRLRAEIRRGEESLRQT